MALQDQAPYAPTASVIKALETYRETGLGGGPITPPLLSRLSMGDEVARRVALSLKQLGLIDEEGRPTPVLVAFKQAGSTEYRTLFAELLYDVYSPVFAVIGRDPAKKTAGEVEDAFRAFRPDSLRKRMVTLFLGLCEYAGILEASPARTQGAAGRARPTSNGRASGNGTKKRSQDQAKSDARLVDPGAAPIQQARPPVDDARQRYLDMLIARAENSPELDPALLDRIERALGIAGDRDDG